MNVAYTVRFNESSPTRLRFSAYLPTWLLTIILMGFLCVGALLTMTPTVECSWGPDGSLNCHIERTLLGIPISERTITGVTSIGVGRLNWDDATKVFGQSGEFLRVPRALGGEPKSPAIGAKLFPNP